MWRPASRVVRRGEHRWRETDRIPPWGLALLLAVSLLVGSATVMVVGR